MTPPRASRPRPALSAAERIAAEPLGPVDRAWLEMDDPNNPMVVSAVLEFTGPLRLAVLRRTLAERLLRFHRFRQRVDHESSPPAWVGDAPVDLDYHVRLSRLPASASAVGLRRAIAGELGQPLDPALPLWRVTLFRRPRGGVAALFRGHHAMGDGMAFLRVLMQCADSAVPGPSGAARRAAVPHHGPLAGMLDSLESANTLLEDLLDLALDDLRHPDHLLEQVREGRRALSAVTRVLTLPDDNPPALRRPLSGRRAVGWTAGLTFAPLQRLAHARGVKVNDVFVSALAGALGQYLRETGVLLREAQNLRVSIPVNLRSADDGQMGNYFGLVLLDLPVGLRDPDQRLEQVAQRMQTLKQSAEARAVLVALAAAGRLPVPLEKRLVQLVGGKAVAVVSNLPGPKRRLKVAGARMDNLVFWPPQAGGIGIGVSLFSYAGRVNIGVSADTALIADPQRVVELFGQELAELKRNRRRGQAASAGVRRRLKSKKRTSPSKRS